MLSGRGSTQDACPLLIRHLEPARLLPASKHEPRRFWLEADAVDQVLNIAVVLPTIAERAADITHREEAHL